MHSDAKRTHVNARALCDSSCTGLFSNGGLLTAYAADIADSLNDRTVLFSYFITAWAFARVAAAYIFPLVREDVSACCWCAFVCEVCFIFESHTLTCFGCRVFL